MPAVAVRPELGVSHHQLAAGVLVPAELRRPDARLSARVHAQHRMSDPSGVLERTLSRSVPRIMRRVGRVLGGQSFAGVRVRGRLRGRSVRRVPAQAK